MLAPLMEGGEGGAGGSSIYSDTVPNSGTTNFYYVNCFQFIPSLCLAFQDSPLLGPYR